LLDYLCTVLGLEHAPNVIVGAVDLIPGERCSRCGLFTGYVTFVGLVVAPLGCSWDTHGWLDVPTRLVTVPLVGCPHTLVVYLRLHTHTRLVGLEVGGRRF